MGPDCAGGGSYRPRAPARPRGVKGARRAGDIEDHRIGHRVGAAAVGAGLVEKRDEDLRGGLARVKARALPDDGSFTARTGTHSAAYFAIAVLAVLAFAAAGLVLLAGWSSSLKSLLIGVACIAGPALYLLVMLAGERRLLKETGHGIDGDVLRLALGLRFAADVPVADILSCARLAGSAHAPACVVSPFEAPNVLLTLRHGAVVDAVRFGYPFKPGKTALALYVDDPDGFVGAVSVAVARQLPKYA